MYKRSSRFTNANNRGWSGRYNDQKRHTRRTIANVEPAAWKNYDVSKDVREARDNDELIVMARVGGMFAFVAKLLKPEALKLKEQLLAKYQSATEVDGFTVVLTSQFTPQDMKWRDMRNMLEGRQSLA